MDDDPTKAGPPPPPRATLYWSCFLMGACFLTPWSAFLSAVDYFEDVYPDRDALRWISVCYLPPALLITGVSSIFPIKDKSHGRVSAALFIFVIAILSIPIMDLLFVRGGEGTDVTFAILLGSVVFIALGTGLSEGSFTCLLVYAPSRYYLGYQRGLSWAAVLISVLRIVTKAIFTDSKNGLRISSYVFFCVAVLMCLACLMVQFGVVRPQLDALEPPKIEEHQDLLEAGNSDGISGGSRWTRFLQSRWMQAAKAVQVPFYGLFLNCFVTLTIFPGVPSDVENDALGDWYGVLLVALYAVGDAGVKTLPGSWFTRHPVLTMTGVFLRFLFLPMTFVIQQDYANPFLISFLMLALGVTHGYLCMSLFGIAQEKVNGSELSFLSGNIMTLGLMLGLAAGSVGSLVWMTLE